MTKTPPWENDLELIRASDRRELDLYGCLRRIAGMSYEEKLRIWNQKQARAKAILTKRARRFQEIEQLKRKHRPNMTAQVAKHLQIGEWVSLAELPFTRKQQRAGIENLRARGYVIECRLEFQGRKQKAASYRLVSIPNPVKGKRRTPNHANHNPNHNPRNSRADDCPLC